METDPQTVKNSEDIGKLTGVVDKLAMTMTFEMERGKEDRENMKSVVSELRGLNEKIGSLAMVQTKLAELEGELGKQRHDLRNLENAQAGIPLLAQKIEDIKTDIAVLNVNDKTCKEWRDKHDGAADAMRMAVKAMWTVCGAGVISVVGFVLYLFFTNAQPTLIRKIGQHTYIGQVENSGQVVTGE